jgi:hypothetical protein
MGLFLSMSGVVGATHLEVLSSLERYATLNMGELVQEALTTQDNNCLVISDGVIGVTVLYPGEFYEWDEASSFLSKETGKPVFSFHIHDGDLWMYVLFENGLVVDQFNPIPDYWQEVDAKERQRWRGNATEVAMRVPALSKESIAKYLIAWDDDILESDERKKAYPDDEFFYGDDWQLVDFMKRLGLNYPVDDKGWGSLLGTTYRFICAS